MKTIYAIVNEKGGAAKSSTAVHLAVGLARRGRKVLFCDMDPQGNSGHFFTGKIKHQRGLAGALTGLLTADEIVQQTRYQNLEILPGGPDLAGTNSLLTNEFSREFKLKSVLEGCLDRFETTIIDLPPTRSNLTVNGLVAATDCIIPIHPGTWDLHGFQSCLEHIGEIRQKCRVNVVVSGLLLSRMTRNRVSKDAEAMLRKTFPDLVFRQTIPECSKVQEAIGRQITVFEHAPDHAISQAFNNFVNETISNEQKKRVA